MPPATIFARVQPKSIKINEKYFYEANISKNVTTSTLKDPEGSLEILIPYEGKKHFSSESIKDIKRQSPKLWDDKTSDNPQASEVRIGHLFFANYDKTDLETTLNLSLHRNVIPVDIPVKNDKLGAVDDLRKDEYSCTVKHPYKPNQPDTTPVALFVSIFDEHALRDLNEDYWKDLPKSDSTSKPEIAKGQKARAHKLYEVAQELAQQENFKRSLLFNFQIYLYLPVGVGLENVNNSSKLDRLAIHWPLIVSPKQVTLEILEEELASPVFYDPEKRELEWREIPFKALKQQTSSTECFIYSTPLMRLAIEYPAELYRHDAPLKGKCDIKIAKRALSGLAATYFDATGQKGKIQCEAQTTISLEFALTIEDCFDQRIFSPYQILQFEGVVLDLMRINDIKNLLEDFGFITYARELHFHEKYKYYIVAAFQRQGIEELKLWLVVEGRPSPTTRERKVPPNHTFTTTLDAGHMTIYMRGQQKGGQINLIEIMHDVQEKLNEQFQHVSMVD